MFLTIKQKGKGIYKEKGSKFIGEVQLCSSEKEAKSMILILRKQNPGCVHVCYAYRFGSDKKEFRYSDDGEPSNSAGAPIFGQIKSANLTNTLLTVVRYYGGTKLGVGGLVQAYKTASKLAIENAVISQDEDRTIFTLAFSYHDLPFVMNEIKASNCLLIKKNFDEAPTITLSIPCSNKSLIEKLNKIGSLKIKEQH